MLRDKYHLPQTIQQTDPSPRFSILTLGDELVGKSCLVKRYCEEKVTNFQHSLLVNMYLQLELTMEPKPLHCQIKIQN